MQELPERLELQAFSGKDFRTVLGAFATGVTVVTTLAAEREAYGMTANAFSSVSLDPPLVLVCVVRGTTGSESIAANGVFAVNVLTVEQEPISRFFSSRERPRGWAAFEDVPHRIAVTGCPILAGCAAFVDCRLAASHDAGDHIIFVGEVLALGLDSGAEPLLFHGGQYRYLRTEN